MMQFWWKQLPASPESQIRWLPFHVNQLARPQTTGTSLTLQKSPGGWSQCWSVHVWDTVTEAVCVFSPHRGLNVFSLINNCRSPAAIPHIHYERSNEPAEIFFLTRFIWNVSITNHNLETKWKWNKNKTSKQKVTHNNTHLPHTSNNQAPLNLSIS